MTFAVIKGEHSMKLRAGLRNRIDEFSFNYVKNQTRGGRLLEVKPYS